MKNVLVLGSGGHARVVLDALLAHNTAVPVGFLDDHVQPGTQVDGLSVLGRISQFKELARAYDVQAAVCAVGTNYSRRSIVEAIESVNGAIQWLPVIHPAAVISPSAVIGDGTVIFAGCVINPGADIGAHCIVNTKSSIDHDVHLEPFASTGPGVVTGGSVVIGRESHIGIGAVIRHQTRIGCHTIVGAGSVVVRNIPDNCVAYGNPARFIRARTAKDPYF